MHMGAGGPAERGLVDPDHRIPDLGNTSVGNA